MVVVSDTDGKAKTLNPQPQAADPAANIIGIYPFGDQWSGNFDIDFFDRRAELAGEAFTSILYPTNGTT